jgi:hypothetical protein
MTYQWSQEQLEALEHEWSKARTWSPQYLATSLDLLGLRNECTLKDIRKLADTKRRKLGVWDNKTDENLETVRNILEMYTCEDEYEANSHTLFVLDLPGSDEYIIEGPNVYRTNQKNPKKLADGTPYCFCVPFASRASLQNVLRARQIKYWKFAGFSDTGPILEEVKGIGLGVVDGVWKVIYRQGAGYLRVGVINRGGKFVDVAIALISGETGWSVYTILGAVANAVEKETGVKITHWLSDAGTGMTCGLKRILTGRLDQIFINHDEELPATASSTATRNIPDTVVPDDFEDNPLRVLGLTSWKFPQVPDVPSAEFDLRDLPSEDILDDGQCPNGINLDEESFQ